MSDIYSTPNSDLEDSSDVQVGELASRWKRLFAALIDTVIALAFSIPLMMVMGVWDDAMNGIQPGFGTTLFMGALGVVFYVAVHGYFLATNGQSIGKKVLSIRIVDMNGELLPFAKLMGMRYAPVVVVSLIPFIGQYLITIESLFVFRKDKRCVHDLIAGTQVVNAD